MKLRDIRVGDAVRVDEELATYRVEAKNKKTGMLRLEALDPSPRVVWDDVHEFRCQLVGAFK